MSTVIVGLSFGDEGKGKIIDWYAEDADVVVRYGGGANSGHTIYHNGAKIVLRLISSGVFHENCKCVLAQGMVIDPIVLSKEILNLRHKKINLQGRLFVSNKAHIVTAKHIADDSNGRLSAKIGTTKKGIGPAYTDKVSRDGLRINDLMTATEKDLPWLCSIAGGSEQGVELQEAIAIIKPFVIDTTYFLNTAILSGFNVIFEGAQGTMLDVDHGTYPYVTSSNSVAGGACAGAGVGPSRIAEVIGITKAYATRVGEGPFPTEVNGDLGDKLRQMGEEYGSVTKRPRRVGWFDVPLTKYAAMVNGINHFVLTKLDVLSGLDEIRVCISYGDMDIVPCDLSKHNTPKLVKLPGWSETKEEIAACEKYDDLPPNARAYIEFIERHVGLPISLISVGPEREQVIDRSDHVRELYAKHFGSKLSGGPI